MGEKPDISGGKNEESQRYGLFKSVTSQQIADCCAGVFDKDTLDAIAKKPIGEAIELTCELLNHRGINSIQFLVKKKIIEKVSGPCEPELEGYFT